MTKIALIIPYFGKFSATFPLWLESAKANSTVDFFIYTDNPVPSGLTDNIKWTVTDFESVKKRINEKSGFKVNLKNPYRLCDMKPCYGDVFYNDIKDYDFWGFCDVDLIFGDIRKFVREEDASSYDKIQELGHFVLLRNTDALRTAYKGKYIKETPYKIAFRSKYNIGFDEGGEGEYGFPNIVKSMGYKSLFRRDFFDVKTDEFLFKHKAYKDGKAYLKHAEYFLYDNGRLYAKNQNEDALEERMYVHLQGRIMQNYVKDKKKFYIIPNAFVNDMEEYNNKEFIENQLKIYKNKMKATKKYRIKRKLYIATMLLLKGKLLDKNWRLYVFGG